MPPVFKRSKKVDLLGKILKSTVRIFFVVVNLQYCNIITNDVKWLPTQKYPNK